MRLALPVAVLALSLAVAGCTGSEQEASPASSPTAGVAEGGDFATTADIVAALDDAGVPCEEPMTGVFEGVAEAQSCILNDAEDVVLLRFADEAEKRDYLAGKDALASAVVGGNWAVQTVLPQTAEQVAEALGGEVVAGAGGEQPAG